MKQFLLSLAMLLTIVVSGYAEPISKDAAVQKAKAFLSSRHSGEIGGVNLVSLERRKAPGNQAESSTPFYIFNNDNDKGFVIIAGDDCAEEVLGYADNGHFDPANMPANMKAWLDGYAEEMELAKTGARGARATKANENGVTLTQARQVIAPMLKTRWNQDGPFNLECFTSTGEQAIAGCLSVALTQVMYYHRWPAGSTSTIPAYTTSGGGSYSALPATTFDWESMKHAYNGYETVGSPEADAVAHLFSYCSHALKMDFGTTSSGASEVECVTALNNYFGYANKAVCVSRESFGYEDWENMLFNELQHGRPVIYTGTTVAGTRHSFVCDGYDGEEMYHINWGWSGECDGYFRLNAVNPGIQNSGGNTNSGYSVKQTMVIGISPVAVDNVSTIGDEGVERVKVVSFKPTNSNATYNYNGGEFSSVAVDYSFSVSVTGNYVLGIGLYQGEQMLQNRTISTYAITSGMNWNARNLYLNGLGKNLPNGVYQLKCLCKPSGTSEWLKNEDADSKFIEVAISGGTAVFTAREIVPQVEVTGVEQLYEAGTKKHIRVHLKNNTDLNFSQTLFLKVQTIVYSKENAYVAAGEESFVDFVFKSNMKIPFTLTIASGSSSNAIYVDEAFTFAEAPEQPEVEIVDCQVKNLDEQGMRMFGRVAEAVLTLRNASDNEYGGIASFSVSRTTKHVAAGVIWDKYPTTCDVDLAPGETKVVTLQYPGLYAGDEVWFSVQCAGQTYDLGNSTNPYIVTDGYVEWDGKGMRLAREFTGTVVVSDNAAAVSFEGLDLSGANITPNANPNTIYYMDADDATPASLQGKNVVKDANAVESISLQGGYDYFIPADFYVQGNISYSFTSSSACDGNAGWQTLVLPFSVQSVKANGRMVDWNRGETDNGKDFWVKEYGYAQGDRAYFHNASEWFALEPYLIGTPENLKGATMEMAASKVRVRCSSVNAMTGSGYYFAGVTGKTTLKDAYVLNKSGNAFVRRANSTADAGTAFFMAHAGNDGAANMLRLTNDVVEVEPEYQQGDVNGDGRLSVADVMNLVSYVIGVEVEGFMPEYGDVNGDGIVSVADVMNLVSKVIE